MKWVLRSLLVGMLLALFFASPSRSVAAGSEDPEVNHCFACHTNPRKLIQITREIAASRKDEPKAEVQSEGEG